jgi:hypothetical protein
MGDEREQGSARLPSQFIPLGFDQIVRTELAVDRNRFPTNAHVDWRCFGMTQIAEYQFEQRHNEREAAVCLI